MRERGILFSRPMIEALLAGRKTQTRRVRRGDANPFGNPGDTLWVRETYAAFGHWTTRWNAVKGREEWAFADLTRAAGQAWRYDYDAADVAGVRVRDAAPTWHKRPALFMPRAASRILLAIDGVRSERLHAIGDDDAAAEGVLPSADPVGAYRAVWEGINGPGSWDADPLVWVVTFRRLAP
jgi:YD repeat-containing protein